MRMILVLSSMCVDLMCRDVAWKLGCGFGFVSSGGCGLGAAASGSRRGFNRNGDCPEMATKQVAILWFRVQYGSLHQLPRIWGAEVQANYQMHFRSLRMTGENCSTRGKTPSRPDGETPSFFWTQQDALRYTGSISNKLAVERSWCVACQGAENEKVEIVLASLSSLSNEARLSETLDRQVFATPHSQTGRVETPADCNCEASCLVDMSADAHLVPAMTWNHIEPQPQALGKTSICQLKACQVEHLVSTQAQVFLLPGSSDSWTQTGLPRERRGTGLQSSRFAQTRGAGLRGTLRAEWLRTTDELSAERAMTLDCGWLVKRP